MVRRPAGRPGHHGAVARILSHPFRLWPNGAVVTVEQESEEADREQIAMLALTRVGERVLVPGFGLTDPVHGDGFPVTELAAQIAEWGPPVTLHDVAVVATSDRTQTVEVTFS